jgi:hypothetical protein
MRSSALLGIVLALDLLGCSNVGWCQQKQGKAQWNEYTDADDGGLFANVFVGGGTGFLAGGSAGMYVTRSLVDRQLFGGGGFVEYAALSRNGSVDGLFSADYQETLKIRKPPSVPHRAIFPFATFGYTRVLGTGNGINYGGGAILHYTQKTELVPALRIEYRDYDLPGQGHDHTIRITWQGEFNTP